MNLSAGTRLGPYEILSALGAGGMGEVYRARDTKLNRDVAIKVLLASVAGDPDRLARFSREAQVLAALNHPNIAHIHGLEEANGITALILELVEGDDLSQRIARLRAPGASARQAGMPLDEALPIARQIAEALEAAHDHGIIHRDLKPANIKVRPDGTVKVLDFGLAKAMDQGSGIGDQGSGHFTNSPTITSPAMMTGVGVILGTAAYMSPEQAAGKAVDKRSDLWAFGVVLMEMLTGQPVFKGETVSHVLAAVLKDEPEWTALPADTPAPIRRLLRRCLEKDRRRRLADAADARLEIDEARDLTGEAGNVNVIAPQAKWQRALPWALAAVLALGLVITVAMMIALRRGGGMTPASGPVEFAISPQENTSFGGPSDGGTGTATQVAVSPDGREIVFVAGAQSAFQIWLRSVASQTLRPIPGTQGGTFPFWSPDSRSIGFFAEGKLKRVQIAGGPATVLCDAPFGRGGSWNRENVILFAPEAPSNTPGVGGLMRVSSAGGVPSVVTTRDPAMIDLRHRWPQFLPDGRHFIYTEGERGGGPQGKPSFIKLSSLDTPGVATTLFQTEFSASFGSGHLLFARGDTLMAQPFDPDARQIQGDAFPVAQRVSREGSRYVGASASANGTLVYALDSSMATRPLTWFDRAGRALATLGDASPFLNLALSPDEKHVAVTLGTGGMDDREIWIIDVARNIRRRLTSPGSDRSPVWSPDGTRIAFASQRSGNTHMRQQLVNGTAGDQSLLDAQSRRGITPTSWSSDGRFMAYTVSGTFPRTYDVSVLPLVGDRKPFALLQNEFLEASAVFSPDGRWIAYSTDESGESNVYVQSFPGADKKQRVSRDGGGQPVWRADGKELFYLGADGSLIAVPVSTTDQFEAGVPQSLFPTGARLNEFGRFGDDGHVYAVTKDGTRFLVIGPRKSDAAPLTVVVNWTAAIQK